jgi:putative FmdB family regulatory protein
MKGENEKMCEKTGKTSLIVLYYDNRLIVHAEVGMPIFEYHCMKCDKDFEALVFGDQKVTCPTCKGTKVKKFLSTFSHKSDEGFSSSQGASCSSCSATSCTNCGSS